jgi:large conductance mechanosensitive channel
MSIVTEFKEFVLRGNVIDLAVGVIVGGAFGGIVTALVKDIITPLIGLPGKVDLSNLNTTIHGAKFAFGDFLNTLVSFVILAAVVFFVIVKPVNYLMSLRKTEMPVAAVTRECPECLSSIPLKATRCAFCTAEVAAVSGS